MRVKVCQLARAGMVLLLAVTSGQAAPASDTRLVTAAAQQDKPAVRTLLKQGVNVNAPRADGATALLFGAHWDDLEMVDLLLRAGADVNAADDHGVTPLARAAENTAYFASVNYAVPGAGTTASVAAPDGTFVARQPHGVEGILFADIETDLATGLLARRYRPLDL